jgi:hypothetical protein
MSEYPVTHAASKTVPEDVSTTSIREENQSDFSNIASTTKIRQNNRIVRIKACPS